MEEDAMTQYMKKRITDEKEHGEFETGCGYVQFDSLAEYICIGRLVAMGFTDYDPNCSEWTEKNGLLSKGVVWVC
tara:strand:- start:463 stop:687 length:225 start_codon:yes stop_codon:yes gene_type:complete